MSVNILPNRGPTARELVASFQTLLTPLGKVCNRTSQGRNVTEISVDWRDWRDWRDLDLSVVQAGVRDHVGKLEEVQQLLSFTGVRSV